MTHKNLSGRDLFDLYTSQGDEYAGVLFTAHLQIGDAIYKMLEDAEKTGRKIAVLDSGGDAMDAPLKVVIE